MRKLLQLFLLLLPLLLLSCSRQPAGRGWLRLSFTAVDAVEESVKGQLSDYGCTLPAAEDFSLRVKMPLGQVFWEGPLTDWTGEIGLVEGAYTVEAAWGQEGEEGFNKPRFAAVQTVQIVADTQQDVVLSAKLANCMVKVARTELFDNYFKDCALRLTTGAGTVIPLDEAESRPVFIEAYRFSLSGTVTAVQTGKQYELGKTVDAGLRPATCYTLLLDVDSVGGLKVMIHFDDEVTTVNMEEDMYE